MNSYYVYALKDPRKKPSEFFYIGKGTGSRAHDHLIRPDSTRKYQRIKEIRDHDKEPLVEILLDDLTELQALKIESELIAAIGTEDAGGSLTNSILPKGLAKNRSNKTVVPKGVAEKAQLGLQLLKSAILSLLKENHQGLLNSEVADLLGLRSDYQGNQKDYLSYSVLGLLLREGKIKRVKSDKTRHFIKD